MATYKAVMRPALEYASSIWSPLASSTSINKLQVIQNAALRTATGCTQDTNIQHLHDETLPIHELQLHASQYTQKTQHPSHPLHKHTTYFNTPRLKTLPLTTAATQLVSIQLVTPTENNTMEEVDHTIINASTVRLPTFSPNQPLTWFQRADRHFHIKRITVSTTKADYTIEVLSESVFQHISTCLDTQLAAIKY